MRTSIPLFFLVLCCLCLAGPIQAAVDQVVLYPDGSEISQTIPAALSQVDEQTWQAELHIPVAADPDSLHILDIKAPNVKLHNLRQKKVRTEQSAHIKVLQNDIQATRKRAFELNATMTALQARIDLWHNAVRAVSRTEAGIDSQAVQSLSSGVDQALPLLVEEKQDTGRQLHQVQSRLWELEKELQTVIKNPDQQRLISIRFQADDLSGRDNLPVTVSYLFPDASWQPAYTLEADPAHNATKFEWAAMVQQQSGLVWKGARLLLATGRTHQRIHPPHLPDWIIQPRPKPRPLRAQDAVKKEMRAGESLSLAQAEPKTAVKQTRATFDIWDLGRQTVRPGEKHRLLVTQTTWSTRFQRILRPSLDHRAFLQAKMKAREAQNIPRGRALFLIQGRTVGSRHFAFAGQETEVFFGSDPQVTGQRILEHKQTGEEGLLANDQKIVWQYRFDLTNGKDRPVRIRLEEAKPQSRHEDIQIRIFSPEYELQQTEDTLVWELKLAAGEERAVPLRIEVKAPEDMELMGTR